MEEDPTRAGAGGVDAEGERVNIVLSAIKKNGFSLTTFLEAYLTNQSVSVKRKSAQFTGKNGGFMKVLSMILGRTSFGFLKDGSARSDFESGISDELMEWVIQLIRWEAKSVVKLPEARCAPSELNPEKCSTF